MNNKIKKLLVTPLVILSLLFSGLLNAAPVGVSISPLPIFQFNQGGIPCAGCRLFQYAAGTTTKQNTYTASTGTTPNANPIILDSNGQAVVYLQTGLNYKYTLSPSTDTDPPTNPYWTEDNIFNNNVIAAPYADATGTADVITASYTVTSPILTDGYALLLHIGTTNATTTPTFAPTLNGILQSAHTIKKFVGNAEVALAAGDLQGVVQLVYDLPNTVWVLQNPAIANAAVANISGGAAGEVLYQSAANTTAFTAVGTSGQLLVSNATSAPSWSYASGTSLTDKIQPVTASVASNALTVTLNPTVLDFRSSTLTTGTVTTISVPAAISVVVPSGATLGTVNAIQSRLAVIAINNAGTVELAVVNESGGNNLDETTLLTTTTISAGATSASTVYSTTGRSNVAFRVVGYIESTQSTAGTWATAPSTIQGYGGQAMAAWSSFGYGQKWQDVTVSRVLGTTYYNTTGKPICIVVVPTANVNSTIGVTVNGVVAYSNAASSSAIAPTAVVVVPPANTYVVSMTVSTISYWGELR